MTVVTVMHIGYYCNLYCQPLDDLPTSTQSEAETLKVWRKVPIGKQVDLMDDRLLSAPPAEEPRRAQKPSIAVTTKLVDWPPTFPVPARLGLYPMRIL
jgi:hypothetical protein